MTLLPARKPRIGLAITRRAIHLTEITRRWGTCSFHRHTHAPLSPQAIKLSPLTTNIMNADELRDQLQTLGVTPSRPTPVALCLPDMCARLAVFELTSLPSSPAEREALVGWKFQQELKLATEHSRIAYRVFRQSTRTLPTGATPASPIHLFAVAIQKNIVESYEQLCLQAGGIPMSISLAGISVFELCRRAMETAQRSPFHQTPADQPTLFFFFLSDWGFSLIVLHEGQPKFFRVKPLIFPETHTDVSPHREGPDSSTHAAALPPDPAQPGQTLTASPTESLDEIPPRGDHMVDAIVHELVASILYYGDSLDPSSQSRHPYVLFLAGSADPERLLPQIGNQVEQSYARQNHSRPSLEVIPLHGQTPGLTGTAFGWLRACPGNALPSFAATVTA